MSNNSKESNTAAQPQQVTSANIDSSTPWIAASDGNLPLLQESLQQLQLPVTVVDEHGYTLLQAASSYSQISTMQWLILQLPQQTDLQVVDEEGDSALHYASSAQACEILLMSGIDRNIRNSAGKTALEAKVAELKELMDDDEFDENDADVIALRDCIQFLLQAGQP